MAKDQETRGTVVVALVANLVIAAAKAVGGLVTGSPALLSEGAHSVADSLNEVFLLASLKRSRKEPDAQHPFGYGKERFFWSLLAAVGIFVMGGCFSFYEGLMAFRETETQTTRAFVVAAVVLVVALLAEGASLARAVRQSMREGGGLRGGSDPTLRTVLAEDSTAVLGVLLALAGVTLHWMTGSPAYEGGASLGIALLLMYVAYRLGKDCRDSLIGEAADPVLREHVYELLMRQPEIDTVTSVLTMRLGMDATLLAARVDLVGGIDSETLEDSLVRIKRHIAEQYPELDAGHVFLDILDASPGDRRHATRMRHALREAAGAQRAREE